MVTTRIAHIVLEVEVGARLGQQLDSRGVALVGCHHESRGAVLVGRVEVGSLLYHFYHESCHALEQYVAILRGGGSYRRLVIGKRAKRQRDIDAERRRGKEAKVRRSKKAER